MLTRSKARARAQRENRSPQANPLNIGHILEKVLGFLDVGSVKAARQVNPLWSAEGAKILIAKCYVEIPWGFLPNNPSERRMTAQFETFLFHYSKDVRMIPNIYIRGPRDLERWKCLGLLEKHVKSLKLKILHEGVFDRESPNYDKAEFLQNILDLFPNLARLKFKDVSFDRIFCSELRSMIKVLTDVFSKPEKDQNPLVITRMDWHPTISEESLDERIKVLGGTEEFLMCNNIMFKELLLPINTWFFHEIPQGETRFVNMINKFLSSSQKTLKKLTLGFCDPYLSLLDFPRMTALTRLELNFENGNFEDENFENLPIKFSPSFQFSEKVPNLDDLEINYDRTDPGLDEDFFFNLLDQTGTAPSVKRLKYSGDASEATLDLLLQKFPLVEDFEKTGSRWSDYMLRILMVQGKHLKRLKLHISLDHFIGKVAHLDSIFTGFSPLTVKLMNGSPKSVPYTANELEQLRVNPSILNMTELEYLKIHFEGTGQKKFPHKFLAVAGEYAFKRMPKELKIFIRVEVDRSSMAGAQIAFEKVSKLPNVTVEFEQYPSDDDCISCE